MGCFYKCNKYQIKKYEAREKAIEWRNWFSGLDCSYGEIIEMQEKFEKLGKRYGLLKEFRENGII